LNCQLLGEFPIVLAVINLHPVLAIQECLNQPGFDIVSMRRSMAMTGRPNRVMRWNSPTGLEIIADPIIASAWNIPILSMIRRTVGIVGCDRHDTSIVNIYNETSKRSPMVTTKFFNLGGILSVGDPQAEGNYAIPRNSDFVG
jgi:hypothetical protein